MYISGVKYVCLNNFNLIDGRSFYFSSKKDYLTYFTISERNIFSIHVVGDVVSDFKLGEESYIEGGDCIIDAFNLSDVPGNNWKNLVNIEFSILIDTEQKNRYSLVFASELINRNGNSKAGFLHVLVVSL